MKRRLFLSMMLASTASVLLLPLKAVAAAWNKMAFDAVGTSEAIKNLHISNETPSNDIELIAPARAENGAIVQIAVTSRIPDTEAIAVLVEKNPTALIGNFMFENGARPYLVTRIKMAETSDVKVIVKAGNQYFTANTKVEVLENGCGGSSTANEKFVPSMKLRAKLGADETEIKAIIIHPMHTGRGKDEFDRLIPAHFVQLVNVTLNDKPVLDAQLGTGISKNPYMTFKLNSAKLGDVVKLIWHDNLGNTSQGEVVVTS